MVALPVMARKTTRVLCECGEIFDIAVAGMAMDEARRRFGYCAILRRPADIQVTDPD